MKMNKMPEFYMIFARKYLLPEFWEAIPVIKLRVSRPDPNTNYVIKVDVVLRMKLY